MHQAHATFTIGNIIASDLSIFSRVGIELIPKMPCSSRTFLIIVWTTRWLFLKSTDCLVSSAFVELLHHKKGRQARRKEPPLWLTPHTDEIVKNVIVEEASVDAPIGLYVHIPYCRRRCRYCDFAIVPIGNRADTEAKDVTTSSDPFQNGFLAMDQQYINALLKELDSLAPVNKRGDVIKVPLRSIYFGGGTPSLAPIESLRRIISAILNIETSPFSVNLADCEITIEADPGTFSIEKLREWKTMGFNRISLGVQSFDDNILESIGRVHRAKDIFASIVMIRSVYGDDANYSIDLISGLPNLTVATWMESLDVALRLEPRPVHLSLYDLQIEKVSTIVASLDSLRCSILF